MIVGLAAVIACNGDSGREATPRFLTPSVESKASSPSATNFQTPTAVEPSPTAPSVSGPTVAPPTATMIPVATTRWTIPTSPAPTAAPSAEELRAADEGAAFGFINSLPDSVRGLTSAFDVQMELTVLQSGQEIVVPASFGGDFVGGVLFNGIPSYSRGVLTVGTMPDLESLEVISVLGRAYVREETGSEWEKIPASVDRTVFPDLRVFIFDARQGTSHLIQTKFDGEEVVDGVDALVVSASSTDLEILGSAGEFDLTYWFAKENGRLIKVEVTGELTRGQDSLMERIIPAESADILLTTRFFDHDKEIEIATPELMLGAFSHDVIFLDDGRVLVTGGFNAIANNNTLYLFRCPIPRFSTSTAACGRPLAAPTWPVKPVWQARLSTIPLSS